MAAGAVRQHRLTLTGGTSLSATGKAYPLAGAAAPQTGSASACASLSPSPRTLMLSGLTPSPIQLGSSDMLAGPAAQADVAGTWTASAGRDRQVLNWTLSAAGCVSGSSSTGCVWSGTLVAMSNARLYSASLSENCADAVNQFAGVACVNAERNRFSVLATLSDETRALALFFER